MINKNWRINEVQARVHQYRNCVLLSVEIKQFHLNLFLERFDNLENRLDFRKKYFQSIFFVRRLPSLELSFRNGAISSWSSSLNIKRKKKSNEV